jgi:PhnB protein
MANDEFPIPAHEANKIMHIALPIGKNILMGNDVPEVWVEMKMKTDLKFLLVLKVVKKPINYLKDSRLAEPLKFSESPWNSYFGMFRDQFGIEWMVDFDPNYKGQID